MNTSIEFNVLRYRVYCSLLSTLVNKKWLGSKQRAELIAELQVLRGGFIPLKYI